MSGKSTKFWACVGYLIACLCGPATQLWAQSDDTYEYSREYIWGVSKNSNSGLIGGVAGKYSRQISKGKFQSFGLEIVNVKNPKEYRRPTASGNNYLFGKVNYLFSVRPQYGREWIVFKKAPQQGVQVNFIAAGGPTLGLLTPYYVQYGRDRPIVIPASEIANQVSPGSVVGSGPFLRGIREGEVDLKIGANIKAALAFEFGTFKNDVTGFEVGFQLEAFPEAIEIANVAESQRIFPSAFIMLFYGSRR
jgi:hypothetical protein